MSKDAQDIHTRVIQEVAAATAAFSPSTHPAVLEYITIQATIASTVRNLVRDRGGYATKAEVELYEQAGGSRFTASPDGVHEGSCLLCLAKESKCECGREGEQESGEPFPVGSRVHVRYGSWSGTWVGEVVEVDGVYRKIRWDNDTFTSVSAQPVGMLEGAGDQDFRP